MSGNYTGRHQHNASGSSHSEVSFFSPTIGVVLLHLAHAEWHPSYQIKGGMVCYSDCEQLGLFTVSDSKPMQCHFVHGTVHECKL